MIEFDSEAAPFRRASSEDRRRIADFWSRRESECGLAFDWCDGASVCWACGLETHTEKCHIVPRMLGGSDQPENLVLLCRGCHNSAPDSPDPRDMWIWLRGCGPTGRHQKEAENLLTTVFRDRWLAAAAATDVAAFTEWWLQACHEKISAGGADPMTKLQAMGFAFETGIHGRKASNLALLMLATAEFVARLFPLKAAES